MNLSSLLLSEGEYRVIRCDILDKLLACRDGDSALLYLYVLRHEHHFQDQTAMRALGFSQEQYDRAVFTLTALLIDKPAAAPASSKSNRPRYSASELSAARTGDHKFAAVCATAEDALGGPLSEAELRSMYLIYDHLGLPAEVIIELLCYLKQESGQVKRRELEREAFHWSDMGISTVEQAQEYLAHRAAQKPLLDQMYTSLHIVGREPLPVERALVAECTQKGFPPDALALAVKRTEQQIGSISLKYVRGILNGWDQKGIHTVSEITALEPETTKSSSNKQTIPVSPTAADTDALSDWERDWLEEISHRREE